MTGGSWWVGKDRDAFNVALKDHTQRVMRRDPPAPVAAPPVIEVAPIEVAPPVVADPPPLKPPLTENARRWNTANIAQGLCARCGQPRTTHANLCERCHAKYVARVQRREGFHGWRPGRRGRIPTGERWKLDTAADIRDAILSSSETADDVLLARAAIVMFVGFLFRQRLDWIVGWTGFTKAECKRIVARLRRARIWRDDGSIACEWLDPAVRKVPKREAFRIDVAFWLDALVAKGDVTRETRADGVYYGLPEWNQK